MPTHCVPTGFPCPLVPGSQKEPPSQAVSVYQQHWCSVQGTSACRGTDGNVWSHLGLSPHGGCCWHLVGRGRAAGRHLRRYRTAPTIGNHTPFVPPDASSAEAGEEGPMCRGSSRGVGRAPVFLNGGAVAWGHCPVPGGISHVWPPPSKC